jgi:hypothetical protein
MNNPYTVYWAHIDAEGKIITFGTSSSLDVFKQPLAPGLTAVSRPPDVNGFDDWKYINGEWSKDEQ